MLDEGRSKPLKTRPAPPPSTTCVGRHRAAGCRASSKEGEDEIRGVFETVLPVRALSNGAREVADRLFFESVVRVNRAGEGAPYTGLKPAGLDVGPVIPLAERAIATGSPDPVAEYLTAVHRRCRTF
jgi:hypothetical protein